MRHQWLGLLVLSGASFCVRHAEATIVDPGFQETTWVSGLGQLTGIAWAPDDSNRLFYLEKTGKVGVARDGVALPTPFASLTTFAASECGLIGIAFDLGFATNHYVYFFATVSSREQQIIRYTDRDGVGVDPTVVLAGLPTLGVNHDGGAVGVGPDGKLYWAIGDNGNGTGIGADLLSLAAKVGRANLDGTPAADNPFADGDGPNNDFIWARGLRNPFTLTWQPSSEELWVTVTGGAFEQIFRPKAGDDLGWNKYESNQPSGFLLPAISYRTNAVMAIAVTATGAVRKNGIVTFQTLPRHRFVPGAKISVTGVADASFNGDNYVVDIPSISSFTFAQPGPDATSGGGVASTQDIGGAVTGGAFWDASGLPAAYGESLFFGDYNSGRITRARVGPSGKVVSVDEWATGNDASVDVEPGPDGALYYASLNGIIHRASYVSPTQRLVISRLHLRTREGADAVVNVHLAQAPATSVEVSIERVEGDSDLTVDGSETLTFDSSNWDEPQSVFIHAGPDADSTDDEAWFELASAGIPSERVRIRATDEGEQPAVGGDGGNGGGAGQPTSATGGADEPTSSAGGAAGEPGSGSPGGNAASAGADGANEDPTSSAGLGGAPGMEGVASSSSSSSCGCRLVGTSGNGYALSAIVALAVLRRRRGRRS